MSSAARSLVTLLVLAGIMVVWLVYGFAQTTKPFPGKVAAPTCVDISIDAGARVRPGDVTVSVLNAGTREGLAGRTMQLFADAGFGEGDSNNAPADTKVSSAQIWTDDPTSPAVRLVASRIQGVEVVERASGEAGVTVVVGDDFSELVAGKRSVKSKEAATVCGPSQG